MAYNLGVLFSLSGVCLGFLLSFFVSLGCFSSRFLFSGPLFFQHNIRPALTIDQCWTNIMLKKQGGFQNRHPLFFQHNICCALVKGQCTANIMLKKSGARKKKTQPETREKNRDRKKEAQKHTRERKKATQILSQSALSRQTLTNNWS